jgi:hypothetical protein
LTEDQGKSTMRKKREQYGVLFTYL